MKNKFIILVCILFIGFLYFVIQANFKKGKDILVHSEQDLFLRVDRIREIKIKNKHIEMPKSVRAVYMSSWIASSASLRKNLVDFIVDSEINSLILDVKDYSGLISFDMNNELIDSYGTDSKRIKDINDFIEELHEKEIYIIARVTVFQDPMLAKVRPDFAFKRRDNGNTWKDKKGLAFINPQKKEAWEYFATIAEESYKIGFDEINFDYIRYPSDGRISNLNYDLNGKTKFQVMKEFYQFLDKRLRTQNIPISADLFGLVASLDDGLPAIGQDLMDALPYFDAVAPMVYPSHYNKKYLGFKNSAEHPYEVVFHEMNLAREKAISLELPESSLRTWIQDFDLGANYGIKEVKDQIRASKDAGVSSYMVWDPKNKYTKKAYYE